MDEMPDARLMMVEECGHVPHLEHPATAAAAIAEFVEGPKAAAKGASKQNAAGGLANPFEGLMAAFAPKQ